MDRDTFFRIVGAFADSPADIDRRRNEVVVQVRDEVLHVRLSREDSGALVCEDSGARYSARDWIIERLGRGSLLARRILEHIPPDALRIPVAAEVVDVLESSPSEASKSVTDALAAARSLLNNQGEFETTVLYVTSDAGEGKTSLLNALAREQAQAYLDKKAKWLLLPVALAGRPFIRLDDVIIGSLANRFRFPFYYFEAVIELARLGGIALALDGFEEMFVETAAGDAISSLGSLLSRLKSEGRVVVAARTAYFRYKGLDTQARLFQGLADTEVAFAELRIKRWSKTDFLTLCTRAGVTDGPLLYETMAHALGEDHPMLTRAVLARTLIEEYKRADDRAGLLTRLTTAKGEDYFDEFVSALLDREVSSKWIDRSGEAAKPLLSRDEHHTLLAYIAEEMWRSGVEMLSATLLETICDLVLADLLRKPAGIHQQARERIKQHALLSSRTSPGKLFEFDHEDFKNFYLGRRIGDLLSEKRTDDLRSLLSVGPLPPLSLQVALNRMEHTGANAKRVVELLCDIAKAEPAVSYSRTNAASMALGIVSQSQSETPWILHHLYVGSDALQRRRLRDVRFEECIVQRTSLQGAEWHGVEFVRCSLERLDLPKDWRAVESRLDQESVPAYLVLTNGTDSEDESIFEPGAIQRTLQKRGIRVAGTTTDQVGAIIAEEDHEESDSLRLAIRAIRTFRRATAVNENTLKGKMGTSANKFVDEVLPELLDAGVFVEVTYQGSGVQRRFRLNRDFARIEKARLSAKGEFPNFIQSLRE